MYQSETLADWSEGAFARFFEVFYSGQEWPELEAEAKDYALGLVRMVNDKLSEIDAVIVELNLSWSLSRMARVDRCILRMAIAEAGWGQSIPVKVVIDEALNLAREYSGSQSSSFLNAALDKALAAREQLLKDQSTS